MTKAANHSETIERNAIHEQLLNAIIDHEGLARGLRYSRNANGEYVALIQTRGNILINRVLDHVFHDAQTLEPWEFRKAVEDALASPGTRTQVLSDYILDMTAATNSLKDVVDACFNALQDTSANITTLPPETAAAPLAQTPPAHPDAAQAEVALTLSHDVLKGRIREYFNAQQEMRWGNLRRYNLPDSTVATRVDGLTDAALSVLEAPPLKTVAAWKARLTTQGKPDSKLVNALGEVVGQNSYSYLRSGADRFKDEPRAEVYARELTEQLRAWMVAQHVSVAPVTANGPEAQALHAALDGQTQGRGAA